MTKTILKDLGEYKDEIASSFLNANDLKDILLVGKVYSDELWFGEDDAAGIFYKQIFPYLYIDETQTEVKAYICFEVDAPRIPTDAIKDMKLIVWCLCHKSCMKYSKTGYSGTRADILADAVERTLRQSETGIEEKGKAKFGIGRLRLESVTYLSSQNREYYGRQLVFSIPDFRLKSR